MAVLPGLDGTSRYRELGPTPQQRRNQTLSARSAPAIAASGVDLISAGWLTHSAQVLDIGLDWQWPRQALAA